jgi:hypothetical protein
MGLSMDSEALELLRENNQILKEILGILRRLTSKEHIEKEDLKAFAINLLADIMVEYKSDELRKLVKDIKL